MKKTVKIPSQIKLQTEFFEGYGMAELIKMSVEPDNKMKYIKLAKNTVIASILITLSLSLLEIPKSYFGTPTGIADDETSDITFAKI